MEDQIPNNLMCPISRDWLEDPVTLPCCGRAYSRQSIVQWLNSSGNCPSCRANLDVNQVSNLPKTINLAYQVEEAQNKLNELPDGSTTELFDQPNTNSKWKATISKLCRNDSAFQTVIGQLNITSTDNTSNFKTLVIPVIDESGSMSGNPTKQVKYSLHRMVDMTYKYPHLLTHLIGYSDTTVSHKIDRNQPQIYYRNLVEQFGRGGGTSFGAAFDEIIKVVTSYKSDTDITSIVIIFLTDGEDGYTSKGSRGQLANKLKSDIEKIWTKSYIVHSVGFGSGHDYEFLNSLQKIGTEEGAYRFADPNEDSDSLSNKINSLLDVIAKTSAIPISIDTDKSPFKIISGTDGKYWLNLTGMDLTKDYNLTVNIGDNQSTLSIELTTQYAEDENDPLIQTEWYSYLIDQIASEVLILSNNESKSLDKQLHCEILQQRSRAILVRLDSTSSNADRLQRLIESIKIIETGGTVNQQKLNDMKFEGKYATNKTAQSQTQMPVSLPNQYTPTSGSTPKFQNWIVLNKSSIKRCYADKSLPEIFKAIRRYKTDKACQCINRYLNSTDVDKNGSNPLIVACSIGRIQLVEAILDKNIIDVHATNNFGYNALDMAIMYGHWRTYAILRNYGCKPTVNGELLLRTCISENHYITADGLVKDKYVSVTTDLVDSAPNSTAIDWLSKRTTVDISIEMAITKGIYDVVAAKISGSKNISWMPYLDIFYKPTPDHIQIIDLILTNKKADLNEILNTGEEGTKWPLFIACEKGQTSLFKMLMKHIPEESIKDVINRQNDRGATCLWMAACNRHIDIVSELLFLGADPNICNLKGDSPLIPCCQKGSDSIVQILLEGGAKLDVYNKNRDNPILICCRTGQAKILEILLKRCSPSEVKTFLEASAEIDGFNPLLASTELDKIECIKVCHKFGADLEAKTADNNQILASATALHLACFYGRLAAAKTLIDLGANVLSQTTIHGYTPLHLAIKHGHIDIVRLLLVHPKGKSSLEIKDTDGRLPGYYAHVNGNEGILEEFFTNKLAVILEKVLWSDFETEKSCADILKKHGESLGCYDYDEITKITMGDQGSNILSQALIHGNKYLVSKLLEMNPNMYYSDNYGITPVFWAEYLGYQDLNLIPNDQVKLMINRVNKSKNSMQNKMLLSLQPGSLSNMIDYVTTPLSPLLKMSDGYALKVQNNVLTTLRKSNSLDHSLLGFLDKLKNNKIFPDGKQCLEYILWDSKVHSIKLIASGENSKLQPIHLMALYLYTCNKTIFENVNIALNKWKSDNVWNVFISCLYQSISLLPAYTGEVYRAVNVGFNIEDYAVGNKINWNTFAIGSYEWKNSTELINQKKGIIFLIKSLTARNISKYTKYPVDSEVIFLPGTQFVITNHYIASVIALGQANIRNSTYKAKEKDLVKAANGETCIIVEMEECENENKDLVMI
jgi:ankyrin repeat protein/Mg-chelatase subunit ChlD